MRKLIVFSVLILCMNIFECNASQIINHNSFTLIDDYLKTFKKSPNDVTFIFEGNGWKNKTLKMTSPEYLLGEFKDKKFRELSFNLSEGEKCVLGLAVLNADSSKIEMQIGIAIDISKGRFIVLNWEGSGFSMKAYKEKPKNLEADSE
ncbi:MAG: hypothetical protein J6T16_06180 [Opitutales bacterium]|nr:hypothetical protein [Opitutales bacterium]